MICESVKSTPEKQFPKGFQGINNILKIYIDSLNKKFLAKPEYEYRTNLISEIIGRIASMCFESESMSIPFEDAQIFFDREYSMFRNLLNDLIKENILIKSVIDTYSILGKTDVIFFAYQRLGDFFIAEQLLLKYSNQNEIIEAFNENNELGTLINDFYWRYKGILEAFAVILPEKYDLELFEVFQWVNVERDQIRGATLSISEFVLDSLKWREVTSINGEKILNWLRSNTNYFDVNQWLYRLTELAAIPDHPFNSDRLFKTLSKYKMPRRDGFWQMYLLMYNGYDDEKFAFPIRRLIEWAWTPEISSKLDFEVTRLTAQTLTWVLATTNRKLRDETTKALVNLLEKQPSVLLVLLKKFNKIDDFYILERLYAIAYGCILRTRDNTHIKNIAQFVYNNIFKKANPPTHILLRDYARNCVEFALYKKIRLNADVFLIRPPYKSKMPELPTYEEIEKIEAQYRKRSKGPKKYIHSQIHHSAVHWDFGRYIIDSHFRDFCQYSFGFENEYKLFLTNADKKLRKTLKQLRIGIELQTLFKRRSKSLVDLFGNDKYQSQVKSNTDFIDDLKKIIVAQFPAYQSYIFNKVMPHFVDSQEYKDSRANLDEKPIKYWIAQRAYQNYNSKYHERYEKYLGNYSYASADTIERIGKKYQWIAFFEMLAYVTDNYMLKEERWDNASEFKYYRGPWQMYIRDINPSFITKKESSDEIENDLGLYRKKKEWWEPTEYTYWNQANSIWVNSKGDLPDLKLILEKKDDNNNEWLTLHSSIQWKEPKPLGKDKYQIQKKRNLVFNSGVFSQGKR